jgi:hypothetical protein
VKPDAPVKDTARLGLLLWRQRTCRDRVISREAHVDGLGAVRVAERDKGHESTNL